MTGMTVVIVSSLGADGPASGCSGPVGCVGSVIRGKGKLD